MMKDTPLSNSAFSRLYRIMASATSETWNSSKQIRRYFLAMRLATSSSGSATPQLIELAVHLAHEFVEVQARLAHQRHHRKKLSIRKDLPRPTPPHMYTPFGTAGRLIRRLKVLERWPLYSTHSS
jgi:hypothetical protein